MSGGSVGMVKHGDGCCVRMGSWRSLNWGEIFYSGFLVSIHNTYMYVYIGKKEGMDMNGNWEMNEGIYIDAKYELEEVSRRAN